MVFLTDWLSRASTQTEAHHKSNVRQTQATAKMNQEMEDQQCMRAVQEAVSYFLIDLDQTTPILQVRDPQTGALKKMLIAGAGDFVGLTIPVWVQAPSENDEEQVNANDLILSPWDTANMLRTSLVVLIDQLHLAKMQHTYPMVVPKTDIAGAEQLIRYAMAQVGSGRVDASKLEVLPRTRSFVGPLKNSSIMSFFVSFEVPLAHVDDQQKQQHLIIWINRLTIQGGRGIALADTTTGELLSGIVPFKTVGELVTSASVLVPGTAPVTTTTTVVSSSVADIISTHASEVVVREKKQRKAPRRKPAAAATARRRKSIRQNPLQVLRLRSRTVPV